MNAVRAIGLLAIAVAISVVMLRAGVWQYDKGQAKEALVEQRAAMLADLESAAAPWPEQGQPPYETAVRVSGDFYNAERQILLDNQVSQNATRTVGVHVWTPLVRSDGTVIVVNRGWLPAPLDRTELPKWATPAGPQTVVGIWRRWPQAGLAPAQPNCEPQQWPVRLNYPDYGAIECLLGDRTADGLLLLGPAQAHGFERDWGQLGLPASRHYGYTVQWIALTVALWIIIFVLWIRSRRGRSKH